MSVFDPQLRIVQLERELQWAHLKIQVLEEKLRQQRIRMLGPQSETLSSLQLELLADEEPSATSDEVAAEARREPITRKPPRERKPHPGRERLPESLPRVEKVIRCEEQTCRTCGQETSIIGYDESEQLDVEPARYFVQVIKREKRACRGCEQSTVTMAPLPPRIVEKGLASDNVVIDTVVSKYCDHLPLYRQAVILEREAGLEIGRATLDGWVMRVGEMLVPVVQAMRKDLLRETYLQADETTVPVQMHGVLSARMRSLDLKRRNIGQFAVCSSKVKQLRLTNDYACEPLVLPSKENPRVRCWFYLVSACGCPERRKRGEGGYCPTGHGHHQFRSPYGRRRAGAYLLALPMFGWAGAGTAKMVVERQVHELGGCGFECVCFGGIPL